MPIYEYQCKGCGHAFECLVFGKEEPVCPSCDGKKVCRLMSSCGFISKGAGGQVTASSNSGCSGCKASSCSSCGH